MHQDFQTAWVEVDLAAIRHNYREVKGFAGPGVQVMAVIKTNAYGHGLELVAEGLKEEADAFGVSTVEEGIRARAAAPEVPVLVFHPVAPWNAEEIVRHNLTASVDSEAGAEALADAGLRAGVTPHAHLKLDTGMSRFGVNPNESAALDRVIGQAGIAWEGVYTHLATAAGGSVAHAALLRHQLGWFRETVDALRARGFPVRLAHALNSAGLLRCPDDRHTMVRTGTLLYGQYPAKPARRLDLRATWSYKTRVISIRSVGKGVAVGYGAEWKAPHPSRIATIPVGYFDGFTVEPRSVWKRQGGLKGLYRRLRGQNAVTVKTPHGKAPVVGRVAAQSAMLDVTELPDVQVGDVVEVPARRVLVGEHIPRRKT